jgi:hypothetical protein
VPKAPTSFLYLNFSLNNNVLEILFFRHPPCLKNRQEVEMIKKGWTIGWALVLLSFTATAFGAGKDADNGVVTVSAKVAGRLTQTPVQQVRVLTINRADVEKGYVDVPAGTVLHVKSNEREGYFLHFHVDGLLIKEALLNINGQNVSVPMGNGLIHRPFTGSHGETLNMAYRLYLHPTTEPGTYPWPVAVAASLF